MNYGVRANLLYSVLNDRVQCCIYLSDFFRNLVKKKNYFYSIVKMFYLLLSKNTST